MAAGVPNNHVNHQLRFSSAGIMASSPISLLCTLISVGHTCNYWQANVLAAYMSIIQCTLSSQITQISAIKIYSPSRQVYSLLTGLYMSSEILFLNLSRRDVF